MKPHVRLRVDAAGRWWATVHRSRDQLRAVATTGKYDCAAFACVWAAQYVTHLVRVP